MRCLGAAPQRIPARLPLIREAQKKLASRAEKRRPIHLIEMYNALFRMSTFNFDMKSSEKRRKYFGENLAARSAGERFVHPPSASRRSVTMASVGDALLLALLLLLLLARHILPGAIRISGPIPKQFTVNARLIRFANMNIEITNANGAKRCVDA